MVTDLLCPTDQVKYNTVLGHITFALKYSIGLQEVCFAKWCFYTTIVFKENDKDCLKTKNFFNTKVLMYHRNFISVIQPYYLACLLLTMVIS